jgi:HTH-type transcriptional regulator/antitoxin HipB
MKKKINNNKNLTSFEDHLDQQYGKRGIKKREAYEQE